MSRHRLKLRLSSRLVRLALFPWEFDQRKGPEIAFGVAQHPPLARPVHEQAGQRFGTVTFPSYWVVVFGIYRAR